MSKNYVNQWAISQDIQPTANLDLAIQQAILGQDPDQYIGVSPDQVIMYGGQKTTVGNIGENFYQYGDQNVVIYRYGELLIMLAEISNELNNGEQLGYINELLNRVGMTPQMGYYGSQDEFRNAVMYEYRFEVLGEGEDAHNNRRRGFDYFLNNTILFHNYNPLHNPAVDLTLSEDESRLIQMMRNYLSQIVNWI